LDFFLFYKTFHFSRGQPTAAHEDGPRQNGEEKKLVPDHCAPPPSVLGVSNTAKTIRLRYLRAQENKNKTYLDYSFNLSPPVREKEMEKIKKKGKIESAVRS
jgi:hypothetical protein